MINPLVDIDRAGSPGTILSRVYPGAKSTIGCGGGVVSGNATILASFN